MHRDYISAQAVRGDLCIEYSPAEGIASLIINFAQVQGVISPVISSLSGEGWIYYPAPEVSLKWGSAESAWEFFYSSAVKLTLNRPRGDTGSLKNTQMLLCEIDDWQWTTQTRNKSHFISLTL